MTANRTGVVLGVQGAAPVSALTRFVAQAEALGYEEAWSEEAGGPDGFSPVVAAGAATTSISLGTGIIPIFGRSPGVIAMEAASVQSLTGGRLRLGLGTSTRTIAERWRGETFERPVTRLREYTEIIRGLLAGEKVSFEGRTARLEGFRIQGSLPEPPPIYLAALGPGTLRSAGELADGVFLGLMTPEAVRAAVATVREAAEAVGRDPDGIDIAGRLTVAIDEDSDELRRRVARFMAFYLSVDVYQRSFARQGFGAAVEAFRRRWESGERAEAAEGIPDELLEVGVLQGTAEDIRARIDEYREAGLRGPVLYPLTAAMEPDHVSERLERTINALAPRRG